MTLLTPTSPQVTPINIKLVPSAMSVCYLHHYGYSFYMVYFYVFAVSHIDYHNVHTQMNYSRLGV